MKTYKRSAPNAIRARAICRRRAAANQSLNLTGAASRFAFAMPKVVVGANAFRQQQDLACLVIAFSSEAGEFALQLLVKLVK